MFCVIGLCLLHFHNAKKVLKSSRHVLLYVCGDEDKGWVPHICCITCVMLLTGWVNGLRQILFTVPIVWREPKDHSSKCYICLTNITVLTSKSKHPVKYPDLPSTIRSVLHCKELPVAEPLEYPTFSDDNSSSDEDHKQQERGNADCDLVFEASCSSSEPHLLTQGVLNNLVCDLNLSKIQVELLGSRLKGWNILHQHTEICYSHNCQKNSKNFSLKKIIWYFVTMFALLYRLLDTNMTQLSGVCLLTIQKLA